MHLSIEHHGDQFNINLASKEGQEAFISIKGCRVVNGSKGQFVSYPATKNQTTGKFWNHVWGSEKFGIAVMQAYHASKPKEPQRQQRQAPDADDDLPPF